MKWIKIGDYVTPGKNPESQDTFNNLGLPIDMSGMTVLDIGAWDGFYSFACEQRGAIVTASDKCVWQGMDLGNGHKPSDDGFDFACVEVGRCKEGLVIREPKVR